MPKKVLITAALPYANGPLHFGHIAGAYLPADCFARFQRLVGHEVLFLCGSDEYGVAITLSAELSGRTPKEHVDIFHAVIQEFFEQLRISFDHYARTTWPGHAETTQQFFLDLLENGYVEEQVTDQLYSEKEHRFLADRYVIGTCPHCAFPSARGDECQRCGASYEATDLKHPRSKLSDAPLVVRPTNHWFLRFDLFKQQLRNWLSTKEWKPNVLHFAQRYIDELRPRAITRDSDWGIPVPLPHAKGKVFYVWFDAPIGYISAAKAWAIARNDPSAWEKYWLDPTVEYVQFIGKDNIPFHAVFFPAMIMGQDFPYKLVDQLPANEFYHFEGRRFSKSEGWTIDLGRFFSRYSADQIRYVISANAPETQDAEFTWKDFQMHCNAELVGKWGNLAHRTLVFARRQGVEIVPVCGVLDSMDRAFCDKIQTVVSEIRGSYGSFHLRRASQQIMELAQVGNIYFDHKKLWVLGKDPTQRSAFETAMYLCMDALKILALISAPILPDASARLWRMLGYVVPLDQQHWHNVIATPLPVGQRLETPEILFHKVEDASVQEELDQIAVLHTQNALPTLPSVSSIPPIKPPISIEDFHKVDLRIGTVIGAERVPKSTKLLRLRIDLGSEERTIVSGIGSAISPEVLVGRRIVIVANLQPAKLMGIESQGMLLAASSADILELPEVQRTEPGSIVR